MTRADTTNGRVAREWLIRVRMGLMAVGMLGLVGANGCARELTIIQEGYVNNAMHINRPEGSRTGDPLELTIVCVHPKDLDHEANDRLAPGAGITSDVWYRDRPLPGDRKDTPDRGTRFWLPKSQVFVMTYDNTYYGKRIGEPLRGAATDKTDKVKKSFGFGPGLHDEKSVIYVFPKFIDRKGNVLPVPPAKFHPPGAYTEKLSVKIGVDDSRPQYGQYIDNTTPRKMHGSEEND